MLSDPYLGWVWTRFGTHLDPIWTPLGPLRDPHFGPLWNPLWDPLKPPFWDPPRKYPPLGPHLDPFWTPFGGVLDPRFPSESRRDLIGTPPGPLFPGSGSNPGSEVEKPLFLGGP